MKYMKQLDSLRAIAVLAVLYRHFYGNQTKPFLFFTQVVDWEEIGVDLFYVLSGFLITFILLSNKDKIELQGYCLLESAKQFYLRRTLRIFPIYYLTLAVSTIFDFKPVTNSFYWQLSYLSNVYTAIQGKWVWGVAHLWSLSVEEQFYLVWPWFIFLIPKKHLCKAIILIIVSAPIFRFICNDIWHVNYLVAKVITIGNMDLFGFGAILALLKQNYMSIDLRYKITRFGLIVGGVLFFGLLLIKMLGMQTQLFLLFRTSEAFFYMWLIDRVSSGVKGFTGKVLEMRFLVFLGKISYGIYLYHIFTFYITNSILTKLGIPLSHSIALNAIIYSVVAIITASLSWYLIEKPISNLKEHYSSKIYLKTDLVSDR